MKRLLTLLGTIIALVALIGCESNVTLTAPDVSYVPTNDGAELALTITEVTDADGYIIYADGVVLDTITALTYNVTTPAMLVEVTAYAGDQESDATQIDCSCQETASLHIWGSGDPSPADPSGFGFNASGVATAYSVSDSTNYPFIDFWIHSVSATEQEFASPSQAGYNTEVNTTKNSGSTDYDATTICDAPGGYTAPTTIAANAVYYFWIDPDDDGWGSSNDYFGKISVDGVNGYDCTLTIAYQPIAGLRWVVTQ
jgi:hypothetical protein